MLVLFAAICGMSFVMSVTNLKRACCGEASKSSMTSRTNVDIYPGCNNAKSVLELPKKPAQALVSLAAVRGFGGQRPFRSARGDGPSTCSGLRACVRHLRI